MGGDTITVCNLASTDEPRGATRHRQLAGPNSPLVVYGDTSQDGVWYGGHPYDVSGYEFGAEAVRPVHEDPDAENEDDEWVFPLANPYDYAGNDVIDAQRACSPASRARATLRAADRRLHRLRRRAATT